MSNKILFHTGDKNRLSVVVSKIAAYSYQPESKTLRIFMTGDTDEFVCCYNSLPELMSTIERLQQNVKQSKMREKVDG